MSNIPISIETFIFLGTELFLVGTEFMAIEIKNGKSDGGNSHSTLPWARSANRVFRVVAVSINDVFLPSFEAQPALTHSNGLSQPSSIFVFGFALFKFFKSKRYKFVESSHN